MKGKIRSVYGLKSKYYIEILDKFKLNELKFLLLNFIIADSEPGDMDIMINEHDKSQVEKILKQNEFEHYTNISSRQILFNKYIPKIGFIQFHIYVGLSFMGKVFSSGLPKLDSENSNINFSFLVFLLESFYRYKFKFYVYNQYKKNILNSNFNQFISLNFPDSKRIINLVIAVYENNQQPNRFIFLKQKILVNHLSFYSFWFNKLYKKLIRIGNNEDLFILFIGVDGSGKSLLCTKVAKIFSKGGVYPVITYLGLNESKVSLLSSIITKKNKVKSSTKRAKNLKFGILKLFQILMFWIEYNFKIFLKFKLFTPSAKCVNLVDRSYMDLLFYNKSKFAKLLFLKYSFRPSYIVHLTGNSSTIYNRKKEDSFALHKERVIFYNNLFNEILINEEMKIKIDTTKNSSDLCSKRISDFIMKKK